MTYPRSYRLPSGDTTTNVDLYAKSWSDIGNKVAKILGLSFAQCNPGFVFDGPDGHVHMPVSVALKIISLVAKRKSR